ncbi:MAG TPA: antibiotic biosynthesis monooxygenase family protein [Novosphingobium sp.]|nr:antibiotic biosynthesis monooxygenase family protein [Novosphingobium sp.]
MITVTMEVPLKPGILPQFQAAIAAGIKDTARRPGFRSIRVLPCEGEDRIILIEEWERAEDYRAYQAWRADGHPVAGFLECVAGPPSVRLWGEPIAAG